MLYAAFQLHAQLRHVSFIDAPAGADNELTGRVNEKSFPACDLTLHAGLLNELLSEFLTTKERAKFGEDDFGLSVAIDAPGNALEYVLLH